MASIAVIWVYIHKTCTNASVRRSRYARYALFTTITAHEYLFFPTHLLAIQLKNFRNYCIECIA